jgi:type IV secretory pathway VirB10-like protein
MPEPDRFTIPKIEDRRSKIAGLLPRDAQSRVLAGVALVMVLVILVSGRRGTPEPPKAAPRPVGEITDPNEGRIREYRERIEHQARRLAEEQARLDRLKATTDTSPPAGGSAPGVGVAAAPAFVPSSAPEPPKDWRELDREKREYQALFASNLALTYRPNAPSSEAGVRPTPIVDPPAPGKDRPGTRTYRLLEGTIIETVLTNRLDSTFSGPVNCLVTSNVYSQDREALVIPQGSRVLGEVRKVENLGQQRVAVVFHRLILPDETTYSLDHFQGLNQLGETGLRDQVNRHYLQIFGASLAIGALGGLAQGTARYGVNQSAADVYQQGVATSFSQSAVHILDRFLNVPPTFTVREGHRIKVILAQDLALPAYQEPESAQAH